MLVTKEEIIMEYRDFGKITIPKGTRTSHHTACGIDENYNFITDLSWIPLVNGIKQHGLILDATHYGINIKKELLEEKD